MSIIFMCAAILVMVFLDQISKIWAFQTLGQGLEIKVWEGVFHFHYLENTGAAWGIFSGRQIFLILLTSLIIVGMLIWLFRMPNTPVRKWYRVAFIMVISGAIGNLIDRVFLGYVRDFLYFKLIDFPIFNVADIFVVCGVILLMLVILFMDKSNGNEEVEK